MKYILYSYERRKVSVVYGGGSLEEVRDEIYFNGKRGGLVVHYLDEDSFFKLKNSEHAYELWGEANGK